MLRLATVRGHWWEYSLSFSRNPRTEGAMENWHHVVGSESLKRAHEKLLMKCSIVAGENSAYWRYKYLGMITKDNIRCKVQLAWAYGEAVCAVDDRARELVLSKPIGAQMIVSPRPQMLTFYTVVLWGSLVLPFSNRIYLVQSWFYRNP